MSEREIIARELADKIRAAVAPGITTGGPFTAGQMFAADLIDPWPGVELPDRWQDMMCATWKPAYGADGTVVGFMTPMGDEA